MGGIGSGWRYRWDKKETTEDYRTVDVRRWYREKLLIPNRSFNWQWTRDGEVVSSIGVKVEENKIYFSYRAKSWQGLG